MNQKTKISIGAVILVALAFWAGTAYANHKNRTARTVMMGGQAQGMRGNFAVGGMRTGANAGSFVSGTVLSKTDTALTVQNQAGGSKIVLVSSSTAVSKSAQGALTDVAVGSSIVATGTTNSDGSITAQTVQVRPEAAPTRR
jgi:hypothetical protein